MTRREFDAITKENWGAPDMASDEHAEYRYRRLRWVPSQALGHDYVALRARSHARRNMRQLDRIPTLHRCTIFRAWAEARRDRGRPLLGGSVLFT